MIALLTHVGYVLAAYFGAGVALLLLYGLFGIEQAKNIFRAGDKLFAATTLCFDGYATLSAECGRHQALGTSFFWGVIVRTAIDSVFGAGHCLGAAIHEKLIPDAR